MYREVGKRTKRVIVVMPVYNAEKTLDRTLQNIPKDCVDDIFLTDDCSQDNTVGLAQKLGLWSQPEDLL